LSQGRNRAERKHAFIRRADGGSPLWRNTIECKWLGLGETLDGRLALEVVPIGRRLWPKRLQTRRLKKVGRVAISESALPKGGPAALSKGDRADVDPALTSLVNGIFAKLLYGTCGPRSGYHPIAISPAVGGTVGWAGNMVARCGPGGSPALTMRGMWVRADLRGAAATETGSRAESSL
jgi:hypothetical protein